MAANHYGSLGVTQDTSDSGGDGAAAVALRVMAIEFVVSVVAVSSRPPGRLFWTSMFRFAVYFTNAALCTSPTRRCVLHRRGAVYFTDAALCISRTRRCVLYRRDTNVTRHSSSDSNSSTNWVTAFQRHKTTLVKP